VTSRPFTLRLPARPDSVPTARHELAKIAYGCGADRLAVASVVSELVGNVVKHAYPDRENPGPVLIRAIPEPGRLLITVADDGAGLRPNLASDGLGLGLPLAGRLTKELRIETDDHGTTVFARFTATGAPATLPWRARVAV
jgi:anti-sigma regulatory factor (Ser/Thr protein kinase)